MPLKDIGIGKKKFDTTIKPWKIPWYVKGLEWTIMSYHKITGNVKVVKEGMEGLKPPYLLLSNHASFIDFVCQGLATFPKVPTWVSTIEEYIGKEWLFRSLGTICKRKFTSDITVVKNILHALKKNKQIVGIFPEARYSLAGITEETDSMAYARLIKVAKVPVVICNMKGNFIRSPQWHKRPYKKIPTIANVKLVITEEEAKTLSQEEIAKRIDEHFIYDDYAYWQNSGVKIKSKYRAQNIHNILYKCPHCGVEHEMTSHQNRLWCESCGHEWELTETGKLVSVDGETYFEHVPDWYRWERECVNEEVRSGAYHFEDTVRVEYLQCSAKGFVPIGTGKLTHDENGFRLCGTMDDGNYLTVHRPVESMYSCHIEYNFKGRGDAIDLPTYDDTYFVFPLNTKNGLTKIHFAVEALYKKQNGTL